MRLKDVPEDDRPRERLLARGPEALADRELLALLLGSGTEGEGAVDLAGALIARFGGLYSLSLTDPHALLAVPGLGPAKAARVAAAFQLARRAMPDPAPVRVHGPADLAAAAAPLLRGLRRERVVIVICDAGGAVIRVAPLTEGDTDRCLIGVRDVLSTVLCSGGVAFGLAHNHPSGRLEPSEPDLRVTVRVIEAARTVGLRFLDHIIVTDTAWRRIGAPADPVAVPVPPPPRVPPDGPARSRSRYGEAQPSATGS